MKATNSSTVTLRCRRRKNDDLASLDDDEDRQPAPAFEPQQLFRYQGGRGDEDGEDSETRARTTTSLEAQLLLERGDLTPEDIIRYCAGEEAQPEANSNAASNEGADADASASAFSRREQKAYRTRRVELYNLRRQLRTGRARVDDDGRLVAVPATARGAGAAGDNNAAAPPGIDLPPPPIPNNNNNNNNDDNNLPAAAGMILDDDIDDGDQQEWLEQQERAAADAIARAVERYRKQSDPAVPWEDLELVPIQSSVTAAAPRAAAQPAPAAAAEQNDNNNDNDNPVAPPVPAQPRNFTFRRICIAVLAVATAFLCILVQTLPLFQTPQEYDPRLDRLMTELLQVKLLIPHARECGPQLRRSNDYSMQNTDYFSLMMNALPSWPLLSRFRGLFGMDKDLTDKKASSSSFVDCGDGVLHIPASGTIAHTFVHSKSSEEVSILDPFVTRGIDAIWFMECHPPGGGAGGDHVGHLDSSLWQWLSASLTRSPVLESRDSLSCEVSQHQQQCFRGVHDNFLTDREIRDALELGADLISEGGDHFDIHRDVSILRRRLPSVLSKLQGILTSKYGVGSATTIKPVAFRVNAVGAMDGSGVPLFGSSTVLSRLLNRTNYVSWMKKAQMRNDMARYSLPWPFKIAPMRDPCHLMADLQADDSFAIQTSIFLSDGAGDDYWGGVMLYVDQHKSNNNPRKKIQRGLTVDGSQGRLVVSTGGLENRRCRLPTRAGIRATLQIWWSL